MAYQITVIRQDLNGDEAHQRVNTSLQSSYDTAIEISLELEAGVKQDVPLPSDLSIEHIYIESPDAEAIKIYKCLSPEYWTFSKIFQAFNLTDVSQLALKCDTATTVYIWIGGSL